jgi:hypothetical protein
VQASGSTIGHSLSPLTISQPWPAYLIMKCINCNKELNRTDGEFLCKECIENDHTESDKFLKETLEKIKEFFSNNNWRLK